MAIASPLSQTRQALVEEFLKSFPAEGGSNAFWRRTSEQQLVAQFILQALNDYTEEILRMVEGMNIKEIGDVDLTKPGSYQFVEYPKHPSGMVEIKSYNEALNDIKEELNK